MLLTALTLENFRGIRAPVRIEFAPLTLLFGPNSCGKSTILKALQFTSGVLNAAGGDPCDASAAAGVDLGDFRAVVNDHDVSKPIRLVYELPLRPVFPNYDPGDIFPNDGRECLNELDGLAGPIGGNARRATVTLEVRFDPDRGRAYLAHYQVAIDDVPFGTIRYDTARSQAAITFVNYCHPMLIEADPQYLYSFASWLQDAGLSPDEDVIALAGDNSNTKLEYYISRHNAPPYDNQPFPIALRGYTGALGNLHAALPLELERSAANNPEGVTPDYQAACCLVSDGLLSPAWHLAVILKSAVFLGPLRHLPSREQAEFMARATPNLSTGEAAWRQIIHASPEFIATLNAWLADADKLATPYGIDVFRYREVPVTDAPPAPGAPRDAPGPGSVPCVPGALPIRKRVMLKDLRRGLDLSLQDVGVGLSQLLPILVECLRDLRGIGFGDLVGIEQPELHLHPGLQVRLADLFLVAAKTLWRQLLVETHSEHLLLRCLRRIRETTHGQVDAGRTAVTPDDIAIHFIEDTPNGPRVTRITLDEDGDFLDEWPGGFFEESFTEKFAGR